MTDLSPSTTLFVVLGNQLFPFRHLEPYRECRFFMAEDLGLCTYERHHKQKIVMFLAAMRAYRDELRDRGCTVRYVPLGPGAGRGDDAMPEDTSYEEKLERVLEAGSGSGRIRRLATWEIEDKSFEKRIEDFAEERGLELVTLPSPMFVTPRDVFAEWLDDHRPHMADFYRWQRKRLDLLVDGDSPAGGKWSFDADNREALPDDVDLPGVPGAGVTEHVEALVPFVADRFSDHPGELSVEDWWLPTTRRQALAGLRKFFDERFDLFGPYEDALSTRDPFLFHSVLSPALNLGLVTPDEVVERAVSYAAENDVRMNSLEGFVRQIVGWREFIRGMYRRYSEEQDEKNFFGHERGLTEAWYDGTTGIVPLDDVIRKARRHGYAHHIERLMVAGNLMLLCEIDPREAHRWFMEMFVDSSDWVMGPNVYGMAIFSDGGLFTTKPYICGSNYLLKMSDYGKSDRKKSPFEDSDATWCDVVDGLYWRFVDRNRDFLSKNPRLARMTGTLDRMKGDRRDKIFSAAAAFLRQATRTPSRS